MHMECGCAIFGKHSKFSTMRCRSRVFANLSCEYEGQGTSVSKVCIRFWVFTHEKLAIFQVFIFKVST